MRRTVQYHAGRFPPKRIDWERLLPYIGPANAAVARYEGLLHAIPKDSVLLSPLTTQEAVLSSKIEGTQATFGEVLEFEASGEGSSEKAADIQEVINYRQALQHSVARLDTLPLSQRLIKEAHELPMRGVRGQNKAPGEYRRIPMAREGGLFLEIRRGKGRRAAILAFPELLNIVEGRSVL